MSTMSKLLVLCATIFTIAKGQTVFSYDRTTQEAILDWHNTERSETANGNEYCSIGDGVWNTQCPTGSIRRLKWDSVLASVAQEWAEHLANDDCAWGHSTNEWRESRLEARNPAFGYPMTGMYSYIGENIARSGNTGGYPTGEGIYNNWVDKESGLFEYGSRTVQSSTTDGFGTNPDTGESGNGQIGHYTQVVADRSEYLGCGFAGAYCYSDSSQRYFYYSYTVCQYYPGGNFGSTYENPYTTGTTCTSCDDGYTCNSQNLCDNGEEDNFATPAPTDVSQSPTPEPTKAPTTPEPTPTIITEEPDNTEDTGGSTCASVTVSGMKFGSFNGEYNCLSASTDFPSASVDNDNVYGPVSSYAVYFYYKSYWKRWFLYYNVGENRYYGYCSCSNDAHCELSDCSQFTDFYDWNTPYTISITATSAAYSSSSSNKKEDRLIEGLLIGLGIAIGVFLLSIFIYWCVKRRNSRKNQYSVVDMNKDSNEISNHAYVEMNN